MSDPQDDLDPATQDRLRKAFRRDMSIPAGVDRAIRGGSRARLGGRAWIRYGFRIGAVAAVIGVTIGVFTFAPRGPHQQAQVATHAPDESPNIATSDIRDAFRLARDVRDGRSNATQNEVDALALSAVALNPEERR